MKSNWPTLYKQTSSGKIQQWTISVDGNEVTTVYGLKDGKLQTTVDIIKEGKNLGRANATTPETQAVMEAQSGFDGKKKEGYVENIKIAEAMENTLDGVEPMLAFPIEKKESYATFPAFAQPKFDGLRCLAVMKKGKVILFSRTQKTYHTVPHIAAEIESLMSDDVVLDGELYNHTFKNDFNKITSLIKRDDVHPDHKFVQFHVYDVVAPGSYEERTKILNRLDKAIYCKRVETVKVNSREELEKYQGDCIERGYEGCMYRNPAGIYEHKRSKYLLKVKTFQDKEFPIVDVEEGCGKLMGHVGAFVCKMAGGGTFKATPAMTLEVKEEMWKKRKDYIGKMATVKFQNLTPDGVPRFPIMKCVRDYE